MNLQLIILGKKAQTCAVKRIDLLFFILFGAQTPIVGVKDYIWHSCLSFLYQETVLWLKRRYAENKKSGVVIKTKI